jgi:quinol monooxygenase YgiN
MSDPFIFITTHTVKDGRLEELERLTDEFLEFVQANEPGLVSIGAYLNDGRDRLTLVQVHRDAESMDFHLRVAGEKIDEALDVVENDSVEVYGAPREITRRLLDQVRTTGVPVTINSHPLAGFNRDAAA